MAKRRKTSGEKPAKDEPRSIELSTDTILEAMRIGYYKAMRRHIIDKVPMVYSDGKGKIKELSIRKMKTMLKDAVAEGLVLPPFRSLDPFS